MDTDFLTEGREVNEGEDRKKQLKGRAALAKTVEREECCAVGLRPHAARA